MTDIDDIRSRMRDLTDQAQRMLRMADAGAVGRAECRTLAVEMRTFLVETTTGLLDLADRAAAIGDRRGVTKLYEAAMQVEEHLLQDAPPLRLITA